MVAMALQDDAKSLAGLRVLVVEDEDDIRELFGFLLRAEGACVQTARTARAAVEAAATWEFDVLLTDIGLPDVPGDHLIKEILGMKTPRPRVVVVTGFSEPYPGRARRAGADVVLTKPVDWSDLRHQLLGRPGSVAEAAPVAATAEGSFAAAA